MVCIRQVSLSHRGSTALPRFILAPDGRPTVLWKALVGNWTGTAELPFEWMSRIPLAGGLIRAIVRECTDNLGPVLAGLSQHDISPIARTTGMAVQSIQRILAVARRATSDNVRSGALVALLGSRFLKLAGVDLTLSLIRANSSAADLGSRLFSASRQSGWDPVDVAMLRKIAADILASQGEYTGNTASSAAAYLFENQALILPPLLGQEDQLGLYPQRRGPG